MEEAEVLFSIGGLEVTGHVTTMWAIMVVLVLIFFLATRKMEKVPGRFQCAAEYTVEGLLNYFSGIMGREQARRYFILLCTLFLFILFSNWSGILPLAGQFEGFKAPTSTLSVPVALALIAFFSTQYAGIREHGVVRYLKKFCSPIILMLPLNIIEELVRPLSLSLRLFGNIFGEEMVVVVLFSLVPYFVPSLMQMLGLLFGFIQAVVFTTLTAIYISSATAEAH
ncbi:MAG: F0F1 ATP synthase subunit A [Syntrophaceticus sp.]|jgi:F-type H+-transporting ATPase subunit a|nr:F0F1 ATP synthase subunit A [Syntrophaceticus sp.]MDD3314282.1 F0F1 ATP synthase subunit A [Syntrophaceticus sp.]MDD4359106.1 F0F1 ATP synthase subunit A [Syntrophaceticus sp.]